MALNASDSAVYHYDSAGQRVRKVMRVGGNIEERLYVGGFEVYTKQAGQGGLIEHHETLHVMDDERRIAMVEANLVTGTAGLATGVRQRFQLENHLGSAVLEVSEAGELISYEEYHPYGTTAWHAANSAIQVSAKRYRYTGQEKDEETGLSYHGTRYYAPWLGRWTSADLAGTADGPNRYQYVRGNPVGGRDPTGLGTRLTDETVQDQQGDDVRLTEGAAGGYADIEIEVRPGPTISELTDEQRHAGAVRGMLTLTTPASEVPIFGIYGLGFAYHVAWNTKELVSGVWGNLTGTGRRDVTENYVNLVGLGVAAAEPEVLIPGVQRVARAGLSAPRALSGSSGLRQVSTGGLRNEVPLTASQADEAVEFATQLGVPSDTIRVSENMNTAWGEMFGAEKLYIGTDVLPNPQGIGTATANSRISLCEARWVTRLWGIEPLHSLVALSPTRFWKRFKHRFGLRDSPRALRQWNASPSFATPSTDSVALVREFAMSGAASTSTSLESVR